MTSCQQIVTSLLFVQFMANLEKFGSRIPKARSAKFTFSLNFFSKKNADISKIKEVLVLKGIFSETAYVCILTYQISSFQHRNGGGKFYPRKKRTPKKPTQIRVNTSELIISQTLPLFSKTVLQTSESVSNIRYDLQIMVQFTAVLQGTYFVQIHP